MGKIVAINKSKTVSYKNDTIEYFEEVNTHSKKESYQKIIDKIKNAKSTVKIASTSNVNEKILDAIHENRELNVYIALKNFSNSKKTVERFDERRVAIIREVAELENNFILIDNIAYLFINPLDEDENTLCYFDESKVPDFNFIFNYYFWNKASLEKMINEVKEPIESPFPPFSLRKQKYINVIEPIDKSYSSLYIPRDKKFNDALNKKAERNYFSDDLIVPIYINKDSFTIGLFEINEPFVVENSWELKENKLEDINSSLEIVPRNELWSKSINIEESKEVDLGEIVSPSIESMDSQEPKEFHKEEYVQEIIYTWVVVPPQKPKNAKKASLYNEHKIYKEKQNKWKEEKNRNQELLNNKKNELSKLDSKNKNYEKNLKKIENEIKILEDKLNKKENIVKPKYELPNIGTLYEDKQCYYLEISTYEELEKVEGYRFDKELRFVVEKDEHK